MVTQVYHESQKIFFSPLSVRIFEKIQELRARDQGPKPNATVKHDAITSFTQEVPRVVEVLCQELGVKINIYISSYIIISHMEGPTPSDKGIDGSKFSDSSFI